MKMTATKRLLDLPVGISGRVVEVAPRDSRVSDEIVRRLAELGFLPGERVRVIARSFLSGEPLAVRVGTGTFALRKLEADCIAIESDTAMA
jgi:ferrous iron transport protein A